MFGFRKDKSQADVDNIKTAIMLAFGYVTGYADVSLIASRVEVHIIAHILPQFADARPPQGALLLSWVVLGWSGLSWRVGVVMGGWWSLTLDLRMPFRRSLSSPLAW